jgi:hypothetical protein
MHTVLGEQQPAVGHDIEDPAVAFYQLRLRAGRRLDFGRQTGGLGAVVSDAAVGNGDIHGSS